MRDQRKLTFYISGDIGEFTGFEKAVARTASKVCGGCTVHHAEGWWIKGAADKQRSVYAGEADFDDVMILTVTCEPDKVLIAYRRIRAGIAEAAVDNGINADWVHVTDEVVIGRHFSIKATIRERDPAGPYDMEDML